MLPTLGILISLLQAIPPAGAASADSDGFGAAALEQWRGYEASTAGEYEKFEAAENARWRTLQERVRRIWPDGAMPEARTYVEYSQDDSARLRIDYAEGVVTAEALLEADARSPERARYKVQATIAAAVAPRESPAAVLAPGEVDLRELSRARLSEERVVAGDGGPRTLYRITLKMVPDYILKRARRVKPWVDQWARRYGLEPAYLLAIIRQESAFNPRARSWVPAYGLMQIVPKYAGKEVLAAVTGRTTLPDAELLYDPASNIMVGATYLQLLRDRYFSDVTDATRRMYLMTASYNWGPHRVRKAMVRGRIPAAASGVATFEALQNVAPDETRVYLRKVREYLNEFRRAGL